MGFFVFRDSKLEHPCGMKFVAAFVLLFVYLSAPAFAAKASELQEGDCKKCHRFQTQMVAEGEGGMPQSLAAWIATPLIRLKVESFSSPADPAMPGNLITRSATANIAIQIPTGRWSRFGTLSSRPVKNASPVMSRSES